MGQQEIKYVSLEDLVPQDHLLRRIEAAINFDYIYDEVKGMYSEIEWGKPGLDPVSLFKIVLIQYLFGIRSMRQTIREIEVNVAYRWFIGYDLFEKIPHFSTFGKNYSRRFLGTDIFERIFLHILDEAVACGFVDASAIFIDGTHIKASANKRKNTKEEIAVSARSYQERLDKEIDEDRVAHGKKPLKRDDDKDTGNTKATPPFAGIARNGRSVPKARPAKRRLPGISGSLTWSLRRITATLPGTRRSTISGRKLSSGYSGTPKKNMGCATPNCAVCSRSRCRRRSLSLA